MDVDLTNPVPDVGEHVLYRGDYYRVTAWIREKQGRRVSWGNRSDATLICLAGICGAIAPIAAVERSGRYVHWSDAELREEQEFASSRAGTFCIL